MLGSPPLAILTYRVLLHFIGDRSSLLCFRGNFMQFTFTDPQGTEQRVPRCQACLCVETEVRSSSFLIKNEILLHI